jgi:hypothetical protein
MTHPRIVRGPQGPFHVFLGDGNDPAVRSELDPVHGWISRSVQRREGDATSATMFAWEDGHWFPVGGTRTTTDAQGRGVTTGFAVVDLKINQPLQPLQLVPPERRVLPREQPKPNR